MFDRNAGNNKWQYLLKKIWNSWRIDEYLSRDGSITSKFTNKLCTKPRQCKIHKYEVEKSCFEKKHGQSLEDFRRKVDAMENEENLEWEDDLNDWEFAVENLKYWKGKAAELQSEWRSSCKNIRLL